MGGNETNVVLRILTFSNKLAFVAACNASVREKVERSVIQRARCNQSSGRLYRVIAEWKRHTTSQAL